MPSKRSSVPEMGAVKIPAYTCRQSRFPHAPQLPCLAIAQAGSMGGKTNMLVKLLTEVWRHEDGKPCFSRIYVFSPSVSVDPVFAPLRKMIEEELLDIAHNPRHAHEKIFFDEPDMEAFAKHLGSAVRHYRIISPEETPRRTRGCNHSGRPFRRHADYSK